MRMGNSIVTAGDADDEWLKRSCASFYEDELFDVIASSNFSYLDHQKHNDVIPNENRVVNKKDIYDVYQFSKALDGVTGWEIENMTIKSEQLLTLKLVDCMEIFCKQGIISQHYEDYNRIHITSDVEGELMADDANIDINKIKSGVTHTTGLCTINDDLIRIFLRYRHNLSKTFTKSDQIYHINKLICSSSNKVAIFRLKKRLRRRAVIRLYDAIARNEQIALMDNKGNSASTISKDASSKISITEFLDNMMRLENDNEISTDACASLPTTEDILISTSLTASTSLLNCERDCILFNYSNKCIDENKLLVYDRQVRSLCSFLIDLYRASVQLSLTLRSKRNVASDGSINASVLCKNASSTTPANRCSNICTWDTNLSDNSIDFSDNNTTVARRGNNTSAASAFSVIATNFSSVTYFITDTVSNGSVTTNVMSMGLCKRGVSVSNFSTGFGLSIQSWGLVDDRSNINSTNICSNNTKLSSFRRLKAGDIITFKCNIAEEWLDMYINVNELYHRFNLNLDTKVPGDFLFGVSINSNNVKIKVMTYSIDDLHTYLAIGPVATTVANSPAYPQITTSAKVNNLNLCCDQGHSMTKHVGLPDTYIRRYQSSNGVVVSCNVCSRAYIQKDKLHLYHCTLCSFDLCWNCSIERLIVPATTTKSTTKSNEVLYTYKCVSPMTVPFIDTSSKTMLYTSLQQLCRLLKEDICLYPLLAPPSYTHPTSINLIKTQYLNQLHESSLNSIFLDDLRSYNTTQSVPSDDVARYNLCITFLMVIAIYKHSLTDLFEIILYLLQSPISPIEMKIMPCSNYAVEYLLTKGLYISSNGESDDVLYYQDDRVCHIDYFNHMLDCFFNDTYNVDHIAQSNSSDSWKYDSSLTPSQKQGIFLMMAIYNMISVQSKYSDRDNKHTGFDISSEKVLHVVITLIENAVVEFVKYQLKQSTPSAMTVHMGGYALGILYYSLKNLSLHQSTVLLSYHDSTYLPSHHTEIMNYMNQLQDSRHFNVPSDHRLRREEMNFMTQSRAAHGEDFNSYRFRIKHLLNLIIINPCVDPSSIIGKYAILSAGTRDLFITTPSEQFERISFLLASAQDCEDTRCERALCMQLMSELEGPKILRLLKQSSNNNNSDRNIEECDQFLTSMMRIADRALKSKCSNSNSSSLNDTNDRRELQEQVLRVLEPIVLQTISSLCQDILEGVKSTYFDTKVPLARLINITNELLSSTCDNINVFINTVRDLHDNYAYANNVLGISHVGCLIPLCLFTIIVFIEELTRGGNNICRISDLKESSYIPHYNPFITLSKSLNELIKLIHSALKLRSSIICDVISQVSVLPSKTSAVKNMPVPEEISRWDLSTSNSSLEFTEDYSCCKRPGSVSCYPAAFASLHKTYSIFTVVLDEAGTRTNWLSIGICKAGFATSSSDGFGRTSHSWGIADDRSKDSENAFFAVGGTRVSVAPRKLKVGDVISITVDLNVGYAIFSINNGEFTYTFGKVESRPDNQSTINQNVPKGDVREYWFGATFANDHKLRISHSPLINSGLTASILPSESNVHWLERLHDEAVDLQATILGQLFDKSLGIPNQPPSITTDIASANAWLDSPLLAVGIIQGISSVGVNDRSETFTPCSTIYSKASTTDVNIETSYELIPNAFVSLTEEQQAQWDMLHQLTDAPLGLGLSQYLVAMMKRVVIRDRGSEAGPNHIVHAAIAAIIWHEGYGPEAYQIAINGEKGIITKPSKGLEQIWIMGQNLRVFYPEEDNNITSADDDDVVDDASLLAPVEMNRQHSLPPPQNGQGPLNLCTLAAVRRARLLLSFPPIKIVNNSQWFSYPNWESLVDFNNIYNKASIAGKEVNIPDIVLYFIRFGPDPDLVRNIAKDRNMLCTYRNFSINFINIILKDNMSNTDFILKMFNVLNEASVNMPGSNISKDVHYLTGLYGGNSNNLYSMQVTWSNLVHTIISLLNHYLDKLDEIFADPTLACNSEMDVYIRLALAGLALLAKDYGSCSIQCVVDLYGLHSSGVAVALQKGVNCFNSSVRLISFKLIDLLINACSHLISVDKNICDFVISLLSDLNAIVTSSLKKAIGIYTDNVSEINGRDSNDECIWIKKGEVIIDPAEEGLSIISSCTKAYSPIMNNTIQFWLWIPSVIEKDPPAEGTLSSMLPLISIFSSENADSCLTIQLVAGNYLSVNIGANSAYSTSTSGGVRSPSSRGSPISPASPTRERSSSNMSTPSSPARSVPVNSMKTSSSLRYNKWTHVCVTFQGADDKIYLYLDGMVVATASMSNINAFSLFYDNNGNLLPFHIGNVPGILRYSCVNNLIGIAEPCIMADVCYNDLGYQSQSCVINTILSGYKDGAVSFKKTDAGITMYNTNSVVAVGYISLPMVMTGNVFSVTLLIDAIPSGEVGLNDMVIGLLANAVDSSDQADVKTQFSKCVQLINTGNKCSISAGNNAEMNLDGLKPGDIISITLDLTDSNQGKIIASITINPINTASNSDSGSSMSKEFKYNIVESFESKYNLPKNFRAYSFVVMLPSGFSVTLISTYDQQKERYLNYDINSGYHINCWDIGKSKHSPRYCRTAMSPTTDFEYSTNLVQVTKKDVITIVEMIPRLCKSFTLIGNKPVSKHSDGGSRDLLAEFLLKNDMLQTLISLAFLSTSSMLRSSASIVLNEVIPLVRIQEVFRCFLNLNLVSVNIEGPQSIAGCVFIEAIVCLLGSLLNTSPSVISVKKSRINLNIPCYSRPKLATQLYQLIYAVGRSPYEHWKRIITQCIVNGLKQCQTDLSNIVTKNSDLLMGILTISGGWLPSFSLMSGLKVFHRGFQKNVLEQYVVIGYDMDNNYGDRILVAPLCQSNSFESSSNSVVDGSDAKNVKQFEPISIVRDLESVFSSYLINEQRECDTSVIDITNSLVFDLLLHALTSIMIVDSSVQVQSSAPVSTLSLLDLDNARDTRAGSLCSLRILKLMAMDIFVALFTMKGLKFCDISSSRAVPTSLLQDLFRTFITSQFLSSIATLNSATASKSTITCNFSEIPSYNIDKVSSMWQQTILNLNNGGGNEVVTRDDVSGIDMSHMYDYINSNIEVILGNNASDEKDFEGGHLNAIVNDVKEFPSLIMTALNHTASSPIYTPSDSTNICSILGDEHNDLVRSQSTVTGSVSFRLKCSSSTTHCRIRALPSLDSPEIGDIRNLTIVEVCGCINGFYKLANAPGYVKVKVEGAVEWERVVKESEGNGCTVSNSPSVAGHESVSLSTLSSTISDYLQYKLYSILCILVQSWPSDTEFPLYNESELFLFLKVCGLGRTNEPNASNSASSAGKIIEAHDSPLLNAFLNAINTKISHVNSKLYMSLISMSSKLVRRVHNRVSGATQNSSVELNNIIPVPPYPPVVVESLHDYENNSDTNVLVHLPGAAGLELVFDTECSTERNYDYVAIYGDEARRNLLSSKYSGRRQSSDKNWPGVDGKPPLTLHGVDKIWISFISDGSNTDWGWKVSVHGLFGDDNYCNNDDFVISKAVAGTVNTLRDDNTASPIDIYSQSYYVRESSIKPYLSLSLNIMDILLLNNFAIEYSVLYSSAEGINLLRNLIASVGIMTNTHPTVLLLFFNICSKLFIMYTHHYHQNGNTYRENLLPLISVLADCIISAGTAAQSAYKSTASNNTHKLTPKSLISSPLMQSLAQAVVMASSLPDVKQNNNQLVTDQKSNSDDGLLIESYSALGIYALDMEICNGGLGLRASDENTISTIFVDITDEMIKERYVDNIGLGPIFPYLGCRSNISSRSGSGNSLNIIYSHTNYVKLVDLKRSNDYDFSIGVMFIPLILFESQLNLLKGRLGLLNNTMGIRFKSNRDSVVDECSNEDTYHVVPHEVSVGDIVSVTLRITSDLDGKSVGFSDETEFVDCMKACVLFQHNGVDLFSSHVDLRANSDIDYSPGETFNDKLLLYTAYTGMSSPNNVMALGCNISHGVELLFMSSDDVPSVVSHPTVCNNIFIDNSRYSKYKISKPKLGITDVENKVATKNSNEENCYIFTSWDISISDSYLVFSENNSIAKRPGSVSCYPAALVKTFPAPVSTITNMPCHIFSITMTLLECPVGPNSMSIGLAHASSFQKSGSDGFGPNRNSWGIIESRSSGDGKIFSNQTSIGTFRKMAQGDTFSIKYDRMLGKAWLSINNGELLQEFDVHVPGEHVPLVLGGTFCNDHKLRIDNISPLFIPDTAGTRATPSSVVAGDNTINSATSTTCTTVMTLSTPPLTFQQSSTTANETIDRVQIVKQWNIARSHLALCYSNENRTCSSGSISLPHPNPAAIVHVITSYTRCSFTAILEEASSNGNLFSFGIALSDFSLTGDNMFGDRPDSWGISNTSRESISNITVKGEAVDTFRAVKANDTFHILIEKDHRNHACSALLSIYGIEGDSYKFKFQNLPYDKDLVIGATLGSNNTLTIIDTSTMSYNPTPSASISENLCDSALVGASSDMLSAMNERISGVLRSKEGLTKYLVQCHMTYRRNSAMKAKNSYDIVDQRSILDLLHIKSVEYMSERFFPNDITIQLNRRNISLPTYMQPLKSVYDIMGILLQKSAEVVAETNPKVFSLPHNFIYDYGIPYCCNYLTKFIELDPVDNKEVDIFVPQAIGYIIDISPRSACSGTRITIHGHRSLKSVPDEGMNADITGEYSDELINVIGLDQIDFADGNFKECHRKIEEMKLLCEKYRTHSLENVRSSSTLTVGDVVARTTLCAHDSEFDEHPESLGDVINVKYDYVPDNTTILQSEVVVRWRITKKVVTYMLGSDPARNSITLWNAGPNSVTDRQLHRRNIMTLPFTSNVKISVKDLNTHGSGRNSTDSISMRVTPIIPATALIQYHNDSLYKDIYAKLCKIYCGHCSDSERDRDAATEYTPRTKKSLHKADREINVSLIKAIQANLQSRNLNDTQLLNKSWQELDLSSMDVVQYPVLYNIVKCNTVEVLRSRYELLQLWNNELFKSLDLINLAEMQKWNGRASLESTICSLYVKCKAFMFACVKEVLISASWSKSETSGSPKFELIISRSRAQKFKEKGIFLRSATHFSTCLFCLLTHRRNRHRWEVVNIRTNFQ